MTSPAVLPSQTGSHTSSTDDSPFPRALFFSLSAIALAYALLAGLHTVSDFDLGWQLATGRWIAQHHHVPSTDLFSYTAAGEPWIYPVGAGLIFYAAYLLGGYSLISCLGAAACAAAVALLLRRGTVVTAAIAVLAVPLIATRINPRADMFTVVLFAAFLSLLWENYQTGRAPLWWLPLLMVAWVNLHLGFVSGLGLIAAYGVVEALEMVAGSVRRCTAQQRLRQAAGWLFCTLLTTLANPWGWGIYRALIRQERVNAQHELLITEWTSVPLNWFAISSNLSLRQTRGTIYLLLGIAVAAAALAVLRFRLGAAVMLLAATYPAVHYVRMGAVFACVVVVVGGYVLSGEMARVAARTSRSVLWPIAACVVALLTALVGLRCFDLATNRHYFQGITASTFGPGLGWWFPQRAAEFVARQGIPGEIFNTYDEGGYFIWSLGPQRRDYIDGRAPLFGVQRIQRHDTLLTLSPDSAPWQEDTRRYNINSVLLPLGRFDGIQMIRLQDWCQSKLWRPVYLDELSAVFVRRLPETEALTQRFPVDCQTAPLPARPTAGNGAEAFNAWANAAAVLSALGRNTEALAATVNALSIFPDSWFLHWLRGNLLFAGGSLGESEQEYLTAVALNPSEVTWGALAATYHQRGRIPSSLVALKHAAQLSQAPQQVLVELGYAYVAAGQPAEALKAFDEAVRSAPPNLKAVDNGKFDFTVAQGRSGAWDELGDMEKAISWQEEAARLAPDVPQPWRRLAQFYERQGRTEDANRARTHAAEVAANPKP